MSRTWSVATNGVARCMVQRLSQITRSPAVPIDELCLRREIDQLGQQRLAVRNRQPDDVRGGRGNIERVAFGAGTSAHQGMSRRRVCLAAPCRFRSQRKFGSRRRDRKMRDGYQPYRGTFPVARGGPRPAAMCPTEEERAQDARALARTVCLPAHGSVVIRVPATDVESCYRRGLSDPCSYDKRYRPLAVRPGERRPGVRGGRPGSSG